MHQSEYEKMYQLEKSHWWFVARKKHIENTLGELSNLVILDYGCGTGGTTEFLKKYGKVYGVDINSEAIKFSKKRNINCQIIKNNKILFKKNTFDLVLLLDVFYHKKFKTKKDLKEIKRVLKPSGILFITNPTISILSGHHDKIVETSKRKKISEITSELKQLNFKKISGGHIFMFTLPLVIFTRLVISNIYPKSDGLYELPKILNTLLIKICELEIKIFNSKSFIGSSIIVVAKNIK